MTITFPRAMPAAGIGGQVFEPSQVNFESFEAGGAGYGVGAGIARWRAEWTLSQAMSDLRSDEWRAFLASLKGPIRTFFGADQERPFPRLYKAGFTGLNRAAGGSFDGSLTTWSQSIGTDGQALIGMTGLPANFQLSRGDYADFRWTTSSVQRRALVRLLEDVTANGSGVIASVSVEPPIPANVPGTAVGHLDNPSCVMRVVTGTQVTPMDRRRIAGATIIAVQDHRA